MEKLKDMKKRNCPDCGVKPGEYHLPNCDIETCPKCGAQLLSCGCFYDEENDCWNDTEFNKYECFRWTGINAERERKICEEKGWYSYFAPDFNEGVGWRECDENHPGARHDLNRSYVYAQQQHTPRLKTTFRRNKLKRIGL